jgi:mycothiol synthase
MAYTFRNPGDDDIWRVYELVREIELADTGSCDFTREDMRVIWRLNELGNIWIAEDDDGTGVGYASLYPRHSTRLRSSGGVVPAHRGRGIGPRLLELLETRGRELAEKASGEEPVMLSQDAGQLNPDAARLFEQHGFELARIFWKMGIDLDREPPEPEIPDGIALRTLEPGRERAVYDAQEEAFRDHWDHNPHNYDEWHAWTIGRESFDPTAWLLAYDGDEIAGGSLNTIEDGVAWVGILFTRRPWRRRGLGLALLQASFRDFWKRGVPKALLGVDAANPTGATRLYERAGMYVVSEEKVYWKNVRA